jgi:hypothetical protein
MMSVCASVYPTFHSPTITQKRFDQLLSNLTNTNLPVVSRVEKLLASSGPRGGVEWKRVGVGRKIIREHGNLILPFERDVSLCRKRCLPFADFSNMADVFIDRRQ